MTGVKENDTVIMKRNILGPRIRELRRELGVTQADLARRVETSASYLHLIEHNNRDIGGGLLRKPAEALDQGIAGRGGRHRSSPTGGAA